MDEETALTVMKAMAEGFIIILPFVKEFAEEDCDYGDNCPRFIKLNHYQCRNCRARELLSQVKTLGSSS